MMAAKVARFKQIDIKRAVKAVVDAGVAVGRVEIDPATGRIVLVAAGNADRPENALDAWLEGQNAGSS